MGLLQNDITEIKNFSNYKNVSNQYSPAFIRSSRCVKISEDFMSVKVFAGESVGKDTENLLEKIHSPKMVQIVRVSDADFVEFIGNQIEKGSNDKEENPKVETSFSLEYISSEAPVVNIINAVCLEAIRKNASDIHIQCDKDFIKIRFRLDGVLQTVKTLDKMLYSSLISRIKVMAGLNIMENRLCQDGRMSVKSGNMVHDFRVSVVPSTKGMSVVLRLFNIENRNLILENLGFSEDNYAKINTALNLPYGMILATGPTGSGKTTTLHSMIEKMDREHLKIVTIEDPVEKEIEGIDQIQINDEIGLSFGNLLRRILRQDPDVIMVGEIRDKETAELAVRASLTGHLILSTLHTNDSIGTVSRLRNLGIESYLIADVLRVCIAQRLLRRKCTVCNGHGCENCNDSGYKGRVAVSEVIEINEELRSLIEKGYSENEIKKAAEKNGFITISEDGKNKVLCGVTDERELMREGLL